MNIVFNVSKLAMVLAVAGSLSVVVGCAAPRSAPGTVTVVASTTVWADVARQVAGRLAGSHVRIDAIITDAAADPHSYEVSPRNELAVDRADVLVENGGGYDDFMGQLRSASGARGTVLDAVRISGHGGDANEHVWYDLPSVARVADRIAAVLAHRDPARASEYRANARSFDESLRRLEAREASVARRFRGNAVAITEPVPAYLLAACGLVDRTPAGFATAVEGEQEVAVRVMRRMRELLAAHRVRAVVYNAQTTNAQTAEVLSAARAAGVPVVPVTETLPSGEHYLGWMAGTIDAVDRALGGPAL